MAATKVALLLACLACTQARLLLQQDPIAALDAALQSPLEDIAGGGLIVGSSCSSRGPDNFAQCCADKVASGACLADSSCRQANACTPPAPVGNDCSSRGPDNFDACCAEKVTKGTCMADQSCRSANACMPPGPTPGSQCVSTGPANYVQCCVGKGGASANLVDSSCPPPRCGALNGQSAADFKTCCTVLKNPASDPTCPQPAPVPTPPPAPPATNVTCFNMTALLGGLAKIQSATTASLNANSDPARLRSIATFGLQQMYDYVRNATTAVKVPGTSYAP
ncbi:hypothetical protein C2E21_7277 [Chlorella sorokiniana]|uniref:Uncharacterized protein n=1 Tax=Chlorella sorokiniana TaxID=3076 RepID=A0A2P6TI04_CHLSO|nr:hypothetical protein C2E21_7277 [Chlorella sorokiniana]|eukprot:PRW33907.1 hypothetical protein C2E21_7277 [Chlorella sorokiniana]